MNADCAYMYYYVVRRVAWAFELRRRCELDAVVVVVVAVVNLVE